MKKRLVILIIGMFLFGTGWAIRSTFIMHDYVNKPIGGALIFVGMLAIGICMYWMIKKQDK